MEGTWSYVALSEDNVQRLVCSQCNEYVSYALTETENKVLCNRCCSGKSIVPHYSNQLFPCVYRFDGCNQLLYPSQVEEHEKLCKGNKYACPQCNFFGTGSAFYYHYIQEHKENVLERPTFEITLLQENSRNYLYRFNNYLIVIQFEITKNSILRLSAVHFGNPSQITYQCVLKSTKMNNKSCKTSLKVCSSLTKLVTKIPHQAQIELKVMDLIKTTGSQRVICSFQINTSDPMSSFYSIDRARVCRVATALQKYILPKFCCCNCRAVVIPPVTMCPSNHVKCENCSTFYCASCRDVTNWRLAKEFDPFLKTMPLLCRWGCNELIFYDELRKHERFCFKRTYRCPIKLCQWNGSLTELYSEHSNFHHSVNVYRGVCSLHYLTNNLSENYLISKREVFYFRMDAKESNGRRFHFRQISEIVVPGCPYKGEVTIDNHKFQLAMGEIRFIQYELATSYILFKVSC